MTVAIRPYADADWPAVAAIIAEVLTEGETYALPMLDDAAARDFWLGQPGAVAVAEVDGVVVGTAKMGPNRPAQGSHIGTASFMVASAARGSGVGRALGEQVIAWHREHGFAGIQFNAVVATNAVAVALWRSLGFEVIGTVPGAFRRPDGGLAGLHVMFLDLAGMRS